MFNTLALKNTPLLLKNFRRQLKPKLFIKMFLVAVGYFGLAWLCLSFFSFRDTNVSPIWPPSGLAFAAVLFWGIRVWPGILIGAFCVNLAVYLGNEFAPWGSASGISALIAAGNTLEAVIGYYLFRRFIKEPTALNRVWDVFAFCGIAAVMCLVSALNGSVWVALLGQVPWSFYPTLFLTWWIGDMTGILTVIPILWVFWPPFSFYLKRPPKVEFLIFAVLLTFANISIFGGHMTVSRLNLPLSYTMIPVMVWGSFRFRHLGVALTTIVTAGFSIWGTVHKLGPFGYLPQNEALIVLQSFFALLVITGMVLTATLRERDYFFIKVDENEKKFRLMIENSADVISLLDQEGRIRFTSTSSITALGYGPEENIGRHFFEFIHPQDVGRISGSFQELLARPGAVIREQCRILHKDGSWRWFEGAGQNSLHEPMLRAVVLNYRDISAKKEAEKAQQYLASIVESSSDAIFSKTLDGMITSWNKSSEAMFGYTAAEMIGRHVSVIVPESKLEELDGIFRRLRTGEKVHLDTVRRRKDGVLVDVSLSISPMRDKRGKLIGAAIVERDITERKKTEKILREAQEVLARDKETLTKMVEERSRQLLRAQKELEQANRLADIGTLATTVAHELRNPLGIIQIAAYNLRRRHPELETSKHLVNIDKKIVESNQIINNLLNYSRIKHPQYEAFDFYSVLEECVLFVAERFKDKNITVRRDYDPGHTLMIEADPYQIREVLNNLLVNACQAFEADGGEVVAGVDASDEFVEIVIEDNGIGIPAEDLSKIFEPFFTKKSKGTGLGLSICNEIISFHNGRIRIDSELQKGTKISVTLPRRKRAYAAPTHR